MLPTDDQGDRKKLTFKLPASLKANLKIRAAELRMDIQDAVAHAMNEWRVAPAETPQVDTAGAPPFATWLTDTSISQFKAECSKRGIPYVQGLAQAVTLWLTSHPSPRHQPPEHRTRRLIICNQKGGVGKTAATAGLGAAFAEDAELARLAGGAFPGTAGLARLEALLALRESNGDAPVSPVEADDSYEAPQLRVLLVDYDPQGHLTKQLGVKQLPASGPSLAKYMARQANGDIHDLIVPVDDERFGGRLDLLPSCQDAFLLDVMISTARNRQATLERALEPLEAHYDVVIIDCPPSLGMAMDAAIYYGRERDGEQQKRSGIVIVVQAEDSSADAYTMLVEQIDDGMLDWRITAAYLGLVVNLYDARDGHVVTSSLDEWYGLGEPRVIGVIPRRKEQREAARARRPLLAYDPSCAQSRVMRQIVKEISS